MSLLAEAAAVVNADEPNAELAIDVLLVLETLH